MFGMKSKAEKKLSKLEALGYKVDLMKSTDGSFVLFALKEQNKHIATYYRSGRIASFNSFVQHRWHDVISYQPTPTAPFVKDFI